MSGVRSGVNGTPTFFINGVRHDGSYERDILLAAIAARGALTKSVQNFHRGRAHSGKAALCEWESG